MQNTDKKHYGNLMKIYRTILKYTFSVFITIITIRTTNNIKYALISLMELMIIASLSDLLLKKKRILGIVLNDILVLIYNIQMAVLFFGNNYILLVMLTNIASLKDLSGKALSYGIGIILVLFFSFIPIQRIKYHDNEWALKTLSCGLAVELFATLLYGNMFSPLFATYDLGIQKYTQTKLQNSLISEENLTTEFFKGGINDYRKKCSGIADSLSDKEAYELLFDTITQKANSENPFLVAIYTFGTHASFDSKDQIYGNGSDRLLNKFYDLDYQFGEFINKFNASSLSNDTIIIFTTDHATYADNDYVNSFPENIRYNTMLDQIPFLIYYKGITPETIDADGRNSLDFAPTVLDYLDISAPNYFLGESLFVQKQNNNTYDTVFEVEGKYLDTDGKNISELSDVKRDIIEKQVKKYFIAKTQSTKD